MELVITTAVDLAEASVDGGFVTWLRADVVRHKPAEDEDDEPSTMTIGQVRAALVHVGRVQEAGADLLDMLDADSGALEALCGVYFDDDGNFDDAFAEGAGSDLLYLADVDIAEAWRGRGVELAVVRRLCDTLGAACELAVISYDDPAEAETWLRMGFEVTRAPESGQPGFLHLALAFRQPRVVEADDGDRFRAVPNPGPRERHH